MGELAESGSPNLNIRKGESSEKEKKERSKAGLAKRDTFFIEHRPRRDYDGGRGEARAGITGGGDCGRGKCDD